MKTSAIYQAKNVSSCPQDSSAGCSSSDLQSPSFSPVHSTGNVAAYELKCVVSEEIADRLEQLLGSTLQLDPYVVAADHGHYTITTLSTDTPEWDCFHRVSGYAKRKYRVRRYGGESIVYLERKSRRGSRVCKQRNTVHLNDLSRLDLVLPGQLRNAETHCEVCSDHSVETESKWDGDQFRSEVSARRLVPVCLMTYQRRAWFGHSENGTIRWTLDRHLRGCRRDRWNLNADADLQPIIGENQVICEFKFRGAMPLLFKSAIQELQLSPGGFSKFRHCVSALYGLTIDGKTNPVVQDSSVQAVSGGEDRHA